MVKKRIDTSKNKLHQIYYFLLFKIKSSLFHKFKKPLLTGVKLTNICNLKCLHCPFWRNEKKQSLSWEKITQILRKLHDDGVRIVIFEGGEPLLWKDFKENKNINDVINLSKTYFFSTAVTTNGTIDLSDINSDIIFVSLDGLEKTQNSIRGNIFDIIINNIKNNSDKKIIINITISKLNIDDVIPLIKFMQGKVFGITVQFFYPYEDVENLSLSVDEKEKIINEILTLKKEGYNILDSKAALKSMIRNTWVCKDFLIASVDPDGSINYGCYLKNRVKNISCKNCGFLAHCEISLAYGLNFDALFSAKNIFWGKASHGKS
ncbi:MAG: radical SAM protein [Actinobacteria bacterium]|nr:radical SAM protein [Actinomycetota bacterium]